MHIPVPIPQTRKGVIIVLSIAVVLLAAACVGVLLSHDKSQRMLKEYGQPDYSSLSADQLQDGLIIQGTIDRAIDSYAERYKTELGMRASKESETTYYLIPVYAADGTLQYFMTYAADPKDFEIMDAVVRQTWSDTAEQTQLTIKNGSIIKLPDDMKRLLEKWITSADFYGGASFLDWCAAQNLFGTGDTAVIRSKIVPFMMYGDKNGGSILSLFWVFLGIGALVLAVLLILIFYKKPIKGFDTPARDEFRNVGKY